SRGVPEVEALEIQDERRGSIRAAAEERAGELERSWLDRVHPARLLALRAIAALLVVAGAIAVARPGLHASSLAAVVGPAVMFALYFAAAPPLSWNGGTRTPVPAYLGFYLAGVVVSAVLARLLGATRDGFVRASIVAWVVPAAVGIARFGLGPGGLE